MRKKTAGFATWAPLALLLLGGCSADYKDISSETGRRAIMDDAINDLTSGNCVAALEKLQPLIASRWVDNEMRMLYASAFACEGGLDFPSIIAALKDSPADIWSPLVKANFSTTGDGKIGALVNAAAMIRQTAGGSFEASARDEDANVYMILVQAELIATIIGPLGNADPANGHERAAGWQAGSNSLSQCRVQVAAATIEDCLSHVESSSTLKLISTNINAICGGGCLGNKDESVCGAAQQAAGVALMNAISATWTGP